MLLVSQFGTASGIGRATALAYAKSGVEGICAADISAGALALVVQECKQASTNPKFQAIAVAVDVTKEEEVTTMVRKAVETFGRIDYAANVAGVSPLQLSRSSRAEQDSEQVAEPKPALITENTLDEWDRVMNVNARGVFVCMREEIKAMLLNEPLSMISGKPPTRGAILNMGSAASLVALPGYAAYTASKHVRAYPNIAVKTVIDRTSIGCQRFYESCWCVSRYEAKCYASRLLTMHLQL